MFVPFKSVVFVTCTDKSEINGRAPLVESLEMLNILPEISIGRMFRPEVLTNLAIESAPLSGIVTFHVRRSLVLVLHVKDNCSLGQTDTLPRGSNCISFSAPTIIICHTEICRATVKLYL